MAFVVLTRGLHRRAVHRPLPAVPDLERWTNQRGSILVPRASRTLARAPRGPRRRPARQARLGAEPSARPSRGVAAPVVAVIRGRVRLPPCAIAPLPVALR